MVGVEYSATLITVTCVEMHYIGHIALKMYKQCMVSYELQEKKLK